MTQKEQLDYPKDLYNYVPENSQRYLFEFNKKTTVNTNPLADKNQPVCTLSVNERNDETFESKFSNARALCTREIKYKSKHSNTFSSSNSYYFQLTIDENYQKIDENNYLEVSQQGS